MGLVMALYMVSVFPNAVDVTALNISIVLRVFIACDFGVENGS